jgi:hypothetical protein
VQQVLQKSLEYVRFPKHPVEEVLPPRGKNNPVATKVRR